MTTPPTSATPTDPVLNKVREFLTFSGLTYAVIAVEQNNILLMRAGGYDPDAFFLAFRKYAKNGMDADDKPNARWFRVEKGAVKETGYAAIVEEAKNYL